MSLGKNIYKKYNPRKIIIYLSFNTVNKQYLPIIDKADSYRK